jgi:hypothetical protein
LTAELHQLTTVLVEVAGRSKLETAFRDMRTAGAVASAILLQRITSAE